MKNLVKLFCVFLVSLISLQSHSQSIGIKGGLNMSTMLAEDDEATYSDDFDMKPGFHFGAAAEIPFSPLMSLEAGLLYSTKGFKAEETEQGITIKETFALNYIDVPVNIKVGAGAAGFKVYGAAGPYVGLGLSGKSKLEFEGGGMSDSDEEDVSFGTDEEEDDLKPLDYGLTFGAGAEIRSFLISVSYDLGLANLAVSDEGGAKLQNRVLRVSVGYMIGR